MIPDRSLVARQPGQGRPHAHRRRQWPACAHGAAQLRARTPAATCTTLAPDATRLTGGRRGRATATAPGRADRPEVALNPPPPSLHPPRRPSPHANRLLPARSAHETLDAADPDRSSPSPSRSPATWLVPQPRRRRERNRDDQRGPAVRSRASRSTARPPWCWCRGAAEHITVESSPRSGSVRAQVGNDGNAGHHRRRPSPLVALAGVGPRARADDHPDVPQPAVAARPTGR